MKRARYKRVIFFFLKKAAAPKRGEREQHGDYEALDLHEIRFILSIFVQMCHVQENKSRLLAIMEL
jgi:hypothetical protein